MQEVSVKLYKFDSSMDKEPRFETYKIPYEKEMRILDALVYIYDNHEPFGLKWYCGTKKCGACGVMVNGKPKLACWEPVQEEMVIEPLRNFPVVRDLVVDFSQSERVLTGLRPILQRKEPYTSFPEKVTEEEMAGSYPLMFCVDCRVCAAACPEMRDSEKNGFAGPYALVQLAKQALDPRDGGIDRAELAMKANINGCDSCNKCTEACPSHVPILTGAIDPLRDQLVKSGKYYIRGWGLIRRLPPSLRAFLKCDLHLTLGEGPTRATQ